MKVLIKDSYKSALKDRKSYIKSQTKLFRTESITDFERKMIDGDIDMRESW
jgi:hypothetical protein